MGNKLDESHEMTEEQINKKIENNREWINKIVMSDEDPSLKKLLITRLSDANAKLIDTLIALKSTQINA